LADRTGRPFDKGIGIIGYGVQAADLLVAHEETNLG
jgi:hypothetical protein